MARLVVATWHMSNQSKTDATCVCQGLGNDTEPSLRVPSWSWGRGLVLALPEPARTPSPDTLSH